MRIRKLHIVWFWGLLLLMSACGEDDYYYPSVKLEFVTVKAGTDGSIQTLIPDNGEALTVSKDRTGSAISPNTSRRVMSNYETLSNGHTATAVIYSLQSLVNGGKQHVFGIVEDLSEFETNGTVNMLLYHDANGDEEYYNRRAYLSVPLDKYADAENPGQKITIKFKYYTYDKDGTAIESGKYCNPGFEYVPDKN